MSDSFADLWNTSVPQKKTQSLSSLSQQPTQQRRPQRQDLFSLLSSTPTSSTPARSSPSIPSLTPSNNPTPPPQQRTQTPHSRSTTAPSSASDAFSDLLSNSSFTSSASTQNLTIAQRAALAEKQRQEALLAHQKQQEKEKSAWAGLDSLGRDGFGGLTPTPATTAPADPSSKPKSSATSSIVLVDDDDDWGLGDFGKPAVSSQDKPKPESTISNVKSDNQDDWDLEDQFVGPSKPPATTAMTTNTVNSANTLWDLEEFAAAPPKKTDPRSRNAPASRVDSPSNDFDFGSREDGLLNESNNNEGDGDDDFMSVFNKPALPPRTQSTNHPSTSSPAPPSNTNATRSASPPPHILGQIVEMGFSIPRAKAALAANNNDVQTALEQLLASDGGSGRGTPALCSSTTNSPAPPQQQPQLQPQSQSQSQLGPGIPRRRDREILRDRDREQRERRSNTSSPPTQTQAEQLLAQASEIGRGMFNKASLFWKEKKEQVQKVVEEQVAGVRASSAASGSSGGSGVGGRPKWMQQQHSGSFDEEREESRRDGGRLRGDDSLVTPKGAFSGDIGEPETRIPRRLDRQRERERERERVKDVPNPVQGPPVEEPEIDLFAPSEPGSTSTTTRADLFDITPTLPSRSRPTQPSSFSTRPHQPQQPKFQRDTTPIPSSIASLKSEANATFKLGQFGAAESLYTRAIDALNNSSSSPSNNHVYYVLLLNNRANARMKIGDVGGAVKDCEGVVGLITKNQLDLSDDFDALGGGGKASSSEEVTIDWEPSQEGDGKLRVSIQGGGDIVEESVDLGEGLVKAIKRRAEAYEGIEKWGKAKRDWEWLRSVGWVRESVRSEAGRGVGRCTRIVAGDNAGGSSASGLGADGSASRPPAAPKPKPRPAPKPATPANNKPSEALENLRTTTAQAEAEDQAKHELKDKVDARLSAWKSGKESNIRALLASLDLVLWEELLRGGSVKVGMHELVTPAQVKVKYMKAVAKVHPDKLNAGNSTLEQRMIAQGVFGALNEAWNAFKQ